MGAAYTFGIALLGIIALFSLAYAEERSGRRYFASMRERLDEWVVRLLAALFHYVPHVSTKVSETGVRKLRAWSHVAALRFMALMERLLARLLASVQRKGRGLSRRAAVSPFLEHISDNKERLRGEDILNQ